MEGSKVAGHVLAGRLLRLWPLFLFLIFLPGHDIMSSHLSWYSAYDGSLHVPGPKATRVTWPDLKTQTNQSGAHRFSL